MGPLACFWISRMFGANLTWREGLTGRVSGSISWIWGEADSDLLVRILVSSLRISSSVGGNVGIGVLEGVLSCCRTPDRSFRLARRRSVGVVMGILCFLGSHVSVLMIRVRPVLGR
jgi:hypothetical protein